MELLFKLIIGHAIGDFALQTRAMALGKNRHLAPPDNAPGEKSYALWIHYLAAHVLVHAGIVWFITGNVWFALAELVLHWVIDFAKCEKWTTPHQDQVLHIGCKIAYAILA